MKSTRWLLKPKRVIMSVPQFSFPDPGPSEIGSLQPLHIENG